MPSFAKHSAAHQKVIKDHIRTIVIAWSRPLVEVIPIDLHPSPDVKDWGIPMLEALAKLAQITVGDPERATGPLNLTSAVRFEVYDQGTEAMTLADIEYTIEGLGGYEEQAVFIDEKEEEKGDVNDATEEDEEDDDDVNDAAEEDEETDDDVNDATEEDEEDDDDSEASKEEMAKQLRKTQKKVDELTKSALRPAPPVEEPNKAQNIEEDEELIAEPEPAEPERRFKRPGQGPKPVVRKRPGQGSAPIVSTFDQTRISAQVPASKSFQQVMEEIAMKRDEPCPRICAEEYGNVGLSYLEETIPAPAPAPAFTTAAETNKRSSPEDDDTEVRAFGVERAAKKQRTEGNLGDEQVPGMEMHRSKKVGTRKAAKDARNVTEEKQAVSAPSTESEGKKRAAPIDSDDDDPKASNRHNTDVQGPAKKQRTEEYLGNNKEFLGMTATWKAATAQEKDALVQGSADGQIPAKEQQTEHINGDNEEPKTKRRPHVRRDGKRSAHARARRNEQDVFWSLRRPDLFGREGSRPPTRLI